MLRQTHQCRLTWHQYNVQISNPWRPCSDPRDHSGTAAICCCNNGRACQTLEHQCAESKSEG